MVMQCEQCTSLECPKSHLGWGGDFRRGEIRHVEVTVVRSEAFDVAWLTWSQHRKQTADERTFKH